MNELEIIAPMIVAVTLILTIGGVALLRPLSKRLGDLLEVMVQERRQPRIGEDLAQVKELLETTNQRLSLLEQRQDFTESLLSSRPAEHRLPPRGSGLEEAGHRDDTRHGGAT